MIHTVTEEWKGRDVFIIGGGPSLKDFDFTLLRGRSVIGVNDALRLGVKIVPVVIFGDRSWWQKLRFEIDNYITRDGGIVYSVSSSMEDFKLPNIRQLKRHRGGLGDGQYLGWNYSSGAAAVNLAVNLGAVRIFLLGFDMGMTPKKEHHWHNHLHRNRLPTDDTFTRFLSGFRSVAEGLAKKYPEVEVYNVTPNNMSRLPHFKKISFEEMERMALNGSGK